jgi:hypothetical protein
MQPEADRPNFVELLTTMQEASMKLYVVLMLTLIPNVLQGSEELTGSSQGGVLLGSELRGKQPLFLAVFAREWQQCIWTQVTTYKASEGPLGYDEVWEKALESCEIDEPQRVPSSSRLSFDEVKLIIRETMELIWKDDGTTNTAGPEEGPFPEGGGYVVIADDTVSDLPEEQKQMLNVVKSFTNCIREEFKTRDREYDSYGYDDIWEKARIVCSELEQEAVNSIPYPYGTDLIVNMKQAYQKVWEGEVSGK